MKKTTGKGIMGYAIAAIVALFLMFFVGTKTEVGTGITKRILTTNGLAHFKKGLDLAGGVRLTYKIDFSKTEQLYADQSSALMQAKKTAQDIILKNIDKRISALGVSDYNAFVQKLQDGEYLVVEIGGVQDMEAAKKLIGKTVELEFKVPNDEQKASDEVKAARQSLAENLFATVTKAPATMKDAGSTKGSQDVYYNNFDGVSLAELPAIYKSHIAALSEVPSGSVYPALLTGVYHTMMTQTESGVEMQTLKGFTMIRFNGKKDSRVENPSESDVTNYATKSNTTWKKSVVRGGDIKPKSLTYDAAAKTLIYYGDEILPAQSGFDLAIYQTLSGADLAAMTTALEAGKDLGEMATEIVNGWQTAESLQKFIPNFVDDTTKKTQVYDELGTKYLVMIRARKTANEKLFATQSLGVETAEKATEIQTAITTKTLYSFEDIHVSDSLRRLPAQDPKTQNVLNGAYFKYASVGQSQTGKPVVSIQFDDQGKEIFCNLTEVLIGKQMAIFVGGNLMTAPVIRDKICGGAAQIDGSFDIKGARQLADDLNSGALPAPLLLSHEETIAPSLGQNALNKALTAGAVGIALIYLFMMAIYGFKKANIALICIAVFLVLLLGISKLLGIVLSLSGIAAIVLSLGMAVDANVLIFERIAEELKGGKTMQSAINDGCDRSWAPIKDGNMTTGIIGLLLFLIGVNVFKGFGTTMLINTLLILLVVTPLTKQLLKIFYKVK